MKSEYSIYQISKSVAKTLLEKYHYLKDHSRGFKSGHNFGLFKNHTTNHTFEASLVGVCIYTGFPVPELVQGMFGLDRTDQKGFFELSRLCLDPVVQAEEHNLASWFVSRTVKSLRKQEKVRAILSYADEQFHTGIIYRACNFVYYGKSDQKSDFWIKQPDGSFIKHSRGKTKGVDGEWRPRSQKHRFVLVYDKDLNIRWKQIDK